MTHTPPWYQVLSLCDYQKQSSRFVLIWRVDIHVLCSIGKGCTGLTLRSKSEESQIMKDKWRRVQNRVESWECVIINHHGWQHYHDQVWLHESPLDRPRYWPGPVLLQLGLRHQQHHLLHQPVHQLCHPVIAGAEKDCKLDKLSRESLIKLSEGERVHGGHRNKRHDLLDPLYKHPNLAARGRW